MNKPFELPINPLLPQIYEFLRDKEKGVILGNPGIGKSLGIPGYLLSNTTVKCYVAMPNLTLAKSLVMIQKKRYPNLAVAYLDKFNPAPINARLIYATSAYLKELFIDAIKSEESSKSRKELAEISVLFIDEANFTSIDNYLIIKMWEYFRTAASAAVPGGDSTEGISREGIREKIKIPRLFLLGSEIDLNIYNQFTSHEIYRIEISSKPVIIEYNYTDYKIGNRQRYIDLVNQIEYKHSITPSTNGAGFGSFLVFLPGKKEINYVAKLLQAKKLNIKILQAHSDLPPDELDKINLIQPGTERVIILSTNIFESVVTIINVVGVFDSILEKRVSSEYESGILETVEISKISAIHRAGRTGRINPGFCFRMCTMNRYESLSEFKPIDVLNVPIYNILVRLISLEFPAENILGLFPSAVRSKIPGNISVLKRLEMISRGRISDLGLFYYDSDLEIRSAAVLWWWLKSNSSNLYGGLIVALLLNNFGDGYFNYNWTQINLEGVTGAGSASGAGSAREGGPVAKTQLTSRTVQYKKQFFEQFQGSSELTSHLNLWLNFINYRRTHITLDKINQIREYAERNSIKAKKLIFLNNTINRMIHLLKTKYGIEIVEMDYVSDVIIKEIIPILRLVYNEKQFILVTNYYSNINGSNERYKLNLDQSVSQYVNKLPDKLISFAEYVNEKSQIYEIKFSVALDPTDLRLYDPNVNLIEYRIPRRIHRPEFKGISELSYIEYPVLDSSKIIGRSNLKSEIPEQGLITVGQVFPFIK